MAPDRSPLRWIGRRERVGRGALVAAAIVAALAFVAAHLGSPLGATAPVAFDTASLTLYADRLASGHVLEAFVPTTPKPLLELVYGPVWLVTHDWRVVTLAGVTVLAAAAAAGTLLGWRLGGPAAGVFAGVVIATSSAFVGEALRGLAMPWAILGWALAGLAITADRPRYALAGVALALATLARVETLAIAAAAAACMIVAPVAPGSLRRVIPGRAWLVPGIALLALPAMCVHDWALAGDPLYWMRVSGEYAARNPQPDGVDGTVAAVTRLVRLARSAPLLFALAAGGAVVLVRRRELAIVVGLASLAAGVAGFMLLIGWQGYVIVGRYADPILAAAILAAAVGLGAGFDALSRRLLSRPTPDRSRLGALAGCLVGIVAAVAFVPIAPLDRDLATELAATRRVYEAADEAIPAIRAADADTEGRAPGLTLPSVVWPRLALQTGRRIDRDDWIGVWRDADLPAAARAGRLVLYLRERDPRDEAAGLAVDEPATMDGMLVTPVFADEVNGVWLLRLGPAAPGG